MVEQVKTAAEISQIHGQGLEDYARATHAQVDAIAPGLAGVFRLCDPNHERPLPGSQAQLRMGGALLRAAQLFGDSGDITRDPVMAFEGHLRSSDPIMILERLMRLFGSEAVRATNDRDRFVFSAAQMEVNDILRENGESWTPRSSTMMELKAIYDMIKDPQTRRNGMALLHIFYLSEIHCKWWNGYNYTDFMRMMDAHVHPLDGASWTATLREAFAKMRAKADFVQGAKAQFEPAGWNPESPIRSSREWARTAWFNIAHVSGVNDETTLVNYSLFALLHNGEFEIYEGVLDLIRRYSPREHDERITDIQWNAVKPLLYAAAQGHISEEGRETVLDALEIIGSRLFDGEPHNRAMMDDLALELSYRGDLEEDRTTRLQREARVQVYLVNRGDMRHNDDRIAYGLARRARLQRRQPQRFAAFAKLRSFRPRVAI